MEWSITATNGILVNYEHVKPFTECFLNTVIIQIKTSIYGMEKQCRNLN